MLSTINFQYQRSFQTHKIYDVIPDRVLSTKLVSRKLLQAQMSPELFLSIGHVSAQTAGMLLSRCSHPR